MASAYFGGTTDSLPPAHAVVVVPLQHPAARGLTQESSPRTKRWQKSMDATAAQDVAQTGLAAARLPLRPGPYMETLCKVDNRISLTQA